MRFTLLPILFSVLHATPILSCTIFTRSHGNLTLVGNNEDWHEEDPYVRFEPAGKAKYGRVLFGFGKNCRYVFGGVNDRGLFYDLASLSRRNIEFDSNKEAADNEIYETMLERCATTEQAIDFLRQFNINGLKRHHIMIVDRQGKSAIIEWGRGKLEVVRKTGDFQVTTNFTNSDPQIAGWYPCSRFSTAHEMLQGRDQLTVDAFTEILSSVQNHSPQYPTVYSNIYDLKNMVVYVYYDHNFDEYITLDIASGLSAGRHAFFLPERFSNLRLLGPGAGEALTDSQVELRWEGSAAKYDVYFSPDSLFAGVTPVEIRSASSLYEGSMPAQYVLVFCIFPFLFSVRRRLIAITVLVLSFQLMNCDREPAPDLVHRYTYKVDSLAPGRYYWKLVAHKDDGSFSQSVARAFEVR